MNSENQRSVDLLIIGAGPGGYVAAIHARKMGLSVILVEKESIGGTCLNVGCIPTKALIHAANLFQEAKHMESVGIQWKDLTVNYEAVVHRKDDVVKQLTQGISFLLEKHGVEVIHGLASFQSNEVVEVLTDEHRELIKPHHVIIATGSTSKTLSLPNRASLELLDSTKILAQKSLPKSMAVIGGGVIGMEFAFIYARFGVDVTVLEFLPQILPSIDKEIISRFQRYVKQTGIQVATNAKVVSIRQQETQYEISYESPKGNQTIIVDQILEAVGRRPNITGFGLENTTVTIQNHGILADEFGRTSVSHIYAIGDVVNRWQLAHTASHQGIIAVDHIVGKNHVIDQNTIPAVVFTTPMIASIGRTEQQCIQESIPYRVVKTPYQAAGKSLIHDAQQGLIKFIVGEDKKVLGATILGMDADHLLSNITIQMTNNLSIEAIQKTIFAHPTLSEVIHEGYLGMDKLAIHYLD